MPRPFPFPLTVGTDICSIPRIYSILRHPSKVNQGAKFINRIFTEAEKAQFVDRSIAGLPGAISRWDECIKKRRLLDAKRKELGLLGKRGKKLARLKNSEGAKLADGAKDALRTDNHVILQYLSKQLLEEEGIVESQLKTFAPFVAGRFAAKEAAIKAHRSRRLTYHDISILKQGLVEGKTQAPVALIKKESKDGQDAWDDAQIVPISISHDGDYATAVCMAFETDQEVLGPGTGQGSENGRDTARENAMSTEQRRKDLEKDEIAVKSGFPVRRPLTTELQGTSKARARDAAVYVGNVHENAVDEDLVRAFEGLSSITKGYICRASGGRSLGYGFVVLANASDAKRAVRLKDGSLLMGYHIRCRRAGSRVDPILAKLGEEIGNEVLREDIYELSPQTEESAEADTKVASRPTARMAWEKSKGIYHRPVRLVKQEEQTFWTNAEDLLREAEERGEV